MLPIAFVCGRKKRALAVFSKDKSAIMIPKKITAPVMPHVYTALKVLFPGLLYVCSSGKLKGVGWEVEGARSTQKAKVLHSVQNWEIGGETILSAPTRGRGHWCQTNYF